MHSKQVKMEQSSGEGKTPIAVVGIGCRMPGGVNSPKAFWEALVRGDDMISEVPADRWSLESFHDPDQSNHSKMVTRRCGFIHDVDKFDNTFFKISPREASAMDPQQRHILEVTYEAFQDAGIAPGTLGESCGVYIGVGMMDYPIMLMETSLINPYTHTGVAHSAVANRISYAFDLRGPSYVVDTACASSMTAMHIACNAIWDGECTTAVAGGCNSLLIPEVTVGFSALGVLSPEGKCCPFSDSAKGYVRSEGWGTFILKPLDLAMADNDHIYSVIRGSAIAANGFSKSLTMPSAPAQEMVMKNAYERSGVPLSSVQYVEAHGTGTPVGDPIEAGAIGRTFGHLKDNPVKIGSVKSNFGHSECAAGITAAIKVALMLEKNTLVPTINFSNANPNIDLKELNLDVQTTVEEMTSASTGESDADDTYTIGLNSFGFAGAVAHMIFQKAPKPDELIKPMESAGWKFGDGQSGRPIILPLSAKSADALKDLAKKWLEFEFLDKDALSVTSWQATRRDHHPYRMAVIANSSASCRQSLEGFLEGAGSETVVTGTVPQTKPKVCFVFPGQGQQWVDMGRNLYREETVFRNTIQICDKIFQDLSGWSVLERCGLFNGRGITEDNSPYTSVEHALNQVEVIQPAIMFIQVALFHLWRHWGVDPDVVVGHSLGEISAAYACGGLTLEEAVAVIYHRSHEQAKQEGTGRMAALRATKEQAEKICQEHENLYIAAVNAPGAITLAGNKDVIATVVEQNPGKAKQLRVTCAFHTPEMDPIKEPFATAMEGAIRSESGKRDVPYYSTVTGEYYDGSFDTEYWWGNIRGAVLFQPAIESVIQETKADVFLEIAASNTLLSSVKQIARGLDPKNPPITINSSLRDKNDVYSIQRAVGTLYTIGVPLDWSKLTRGTADWAPVPTYPWQHQSFWLETEERQKRRLGLDDRTFKGQDGNLTLEMFPFLADHVIGNRIVYPGAGYIEYMVQMSFAETENPALKNINFTRVLPWPEDSDSKKCTLKLGLVKDGAGLQVTCDGNSHSNAQMYTTSKAEVNCLPLEKITERCSTEISGEEFYARLENVGLNYGPTFQMVKKMFLGDGEALAVLHPVPDNKQRVQVAHLDAAFQLALSAVGPNSTMYLPVHIDSLELSKEAIPFGEEILAYANVIDCDSMVLTADITLATEKGDTLMTLKGFQAQNFNGNQSDVPIESCVYTTQWQRASACTLPTSVLTDIFDETNLRASYGDEMNAIDRAEKVLDDIEGVCVSYVRHALDTVPSDERAQGKSYEKYINRFETIAKNGGSKSIRYDEIPDVLDNILEHVPELDSEVSLMKSLGEALPNTLKDPQVAVPLMFCAEGLDRYFYDSLSTRLYYKAGAEAVVKAVREAAKHKKVVRVLELGARIGGLTRFIVDPLNEMGVEKRMEYVFADVSATFFQQAQGNLQEYPFIQYKQVDIERDITEQGFVPGSFDVIVCLDTLHAAIDVQRSTAYMSNLLCRDGLMFIMEGTNTHYLTELWFGALDVCWVFDDFRNERCWLDRQGWLDTMSRVGLKEITSASSPNEFFHSVLVGRKPSASEQDDNSKIIQQDKLFILRDGNNRFASVFLPHYQGEVQISNFSEAKSLDRVFSENTESPMEVMYIYSDEDAKLHALLKLFQAVESYPESVKRLWVLTKGGNMESTIPNGSLAVGLTRAVSNQIPGVPIFSVDLDPQNSLPQNVQEFVRLMTASDLGEREFVIRHKERFVPRVMHQDLHQVSEIQSLRWRVEQDLRGQAGKGASIDDLAFHDVNDVEVPEGHVKIRVKAAPLNFKDVMISLGLLEGLEKDTHPSFGLECAGIVDEVTPGAQGFRVGDEVIAFGKSCFGSHAICDARLTVPKPSNLNFVDSSSIGVVFVTAYLCLVERANLNKDETVLIHSACGGVGLAAVQIAKMIGAKVICTAGTEEKRNYLRKELGVEMVSDSRSSRFYDDVMEWTDGQGVDVILNSLSGKLLQTGISLLGPGGRFCEIGKRDILQGSSLPMGFFLENKVFHSCQLDVLMRQRPTIVQRIMRKVINLFEKEELRPISLTVHPIKDLKETFRFMSKGAHIGKIVFEVPEHFQPAELKPSLQQFKPNATYIVTGGFGGIGQALSRWLCLNGAKHIVLVSRSGAKTAAAMRTVNFLKRNKVNLHEFSLDISNKNSVASMLEKLRDDKRVPQIRGIFHLAGIIEEENLADITSGQASRILAAKATGARILHELTLKDKLEVFFVLSSISTTWGHQAQPVYCAANAYLDALAERRHVSGLPALSVQLAPVKGAGYLEDKGQTVKVLAAKGNHTLYVDEFLQLLGQLLPRKDLPVVCLANQDWGATQQFCYKTMLKFHHLAAASSSKSSGGDASCLDADDLEASVKSKMADLLCMSEDAIDVSQPMVNYGVDSLVALEMVNWATNQLGVTISQLDILGGITTASLLEKALESH